MNQEKGLMLPSFDLPAAQGEPSGLNQFLIGWTEVNSSRYASVAPPSVGTYKCLKTMVGVAGFELHSNSSTFSVCCSHLLARQGSLPGVPRKSRVSLSHGSSGGGRPVTEHAGGLCEAPIEHRFHRNIAKNRRRPLLAIIAVSALRGLTSIWFVLSRRFK